VEEKENVKKSQHIKEKKGLEETDIRKNHHKG